MKIKTLILFFIIGAIFTACSEDSEVSEEMEMEMEEEEMQEEIEEEPPCGIASGQEFLTTLRLSLRASNSSHWVDFSFIDFDGDCEKDEGKYSDHMSTGNLYFGEVRLLNESVDPAEDLTEEILKNGEHIQVFFETGSDDLQIIYEDADINGNPIGMKFNAITKDAGDEIFKVTVRFLPKKDAEGVSDGDIANAGGVTYISAEFKALILN